MRMGNVTVLDASWFLPIMNRNAYEEFLDKRIPAARFFDVDRFSLDRSGLDLPHLLPPAEIFARQLGEFGLDPNSKIVCYDSLGLFSAPRAWYMLKLLGFDVEVLEGGLVAWENYFDIVSGIPETIIPSTVDVTIDLVKTNIRTIAEVKANLKSSKPFTIVDVRSRGRFDGSEPEPREGLRRGHIPSSVNLPFTELMDNWVLKSPEEIKQLFFQRGIDLSLPDPIVFSCGSGLTACIGAYAAFSCGKPIEQLHLYDGSWMEWGHSSFDHPIA